jgi:hypothetical protein
MNYEDIDISIDDPSTNGPPNLAQELTTNNFDIF